jgi:hypothetical protein
MLSAPRLALALLLPIALATAAPAAGKKLLFVVQVKAAAPTAAADALIRTHLESLGYAVSTADQRDPVPPVAGVDAIVISSSVSAHVLEGKYRDVAVPIVTWESYILPHMHLTGRREDGDYGTLPKNRYLWMVNAPHPLSAHLPAGLLNVYQRGAPMNWGRPGLGAAIIATLPGDPGKALIFGYEKGATMDDDHLAPARRVFVFLDNATFGDLNPAGLALFDAAVHWAAGG